MTRKQLANLLHKTEHLIVGDVDMVDFRSGTGNMKLGRYLEDAKAHEVVLEGYDQTVHEDTHAIHEFTLGNLLGAELGGTADKPGLMVYCEQTEDVVLVQFVKRVIIENYLPIPGRKSATLGRAKKRST